MHFEHFEQKRKAKRKYLRLKIITNREFNFITAIRPDSTVTDLANRALNAYLELSQQNKTKKQLTVSAVKQGMYFMPKSQIVSNLLSQDEEVEIIIVKAKPKFPEQTIPTQHDFEVLAKQIKNFDVSVSKRPSSSNSKIFTPSHSVAKPVPTIKNNKKAKQPSISSSENQGDSKSPSMASQLQHSKRERKKDRMKQKKLKKLQQNSNTTNLVNAKQQFQEHGKLTFQCPKQTASVLAKALENQINACSETPSSRVNDTKKEFQQKSQCLSKQEVDDMDLIELVTFKEINSFSPNQSKTLGTIQNRSGQKIEKSLQKIVQRSTEKKDKQTLSIPKPPQFFPNFQRDFGGSSKSQQKIQQPKKKVKVDTSGKFQTEQVSISRKGSVDNRSEKTPKVNPIPSPKVVFHFETKHQSPKVIYIPESRTISEMKENIEREKQKMRTMSPLVLPKSSPKITVLQDPFEKGQQSKGMLSSLNKKNKQQQQSTQERKASTTSMDQQKPAQPRRQKQPSKPQRQPSSPRLSYNSSLPLSNTSSVDERRHSSSFDDSRFSLSVDQRRHSSSVDERESSVVEKRKPSAMHPEIIEEESSEEENYVTAKNDKKNNNNRTYSKQSEQNVPSNMSQSQSDESTIKKKSSASSKFHEIQSMIRKFKLEESSDGEDS